MYEFKINFKNRTSMGDHYTVWWWTQSDYVTIIDKVYYADSKKEIIEMIKNDVRAFFRGKFKRAKWIIN